MLDGWRQGELCDIATVNPKYKLPRGSDAPFVAMADVAENLGGVKNVQRRTFTSGGAKFTSGDVLVARITPCLENGKIATVPTHLNNEIAHGSTEFLVLQGIPGKGDSRFISYLVMDPRFSRYAIPKMTGTSGRQRLPRGALESYPIRIPPVSQQAQIADVLGRFDHLISMELSIAKKLSELTRALGRNFRAVSKARSQLVALGDVADVSRGYSYKSAELGTGSDWLVNLKNIGRDGSFQDRGFKRFSGLPKTGQVVDEGDILVALTDLTQHREIIGRPVRARRGTLSGELVASLDLAVLRPKEHVSREWLFAMLDTDEFRAHCLSYCNGTTVVHMSSRAFDTCLVPLASREDITRFTATTRGLVTEMQASLTAAERLTQIRNEIAPLLLDGRLCVGQP